jgi:hypothetical protein
MAAPLETEVREEMGGAAVVSFKLHSAREW